MQLQKPVVTVLTTVYNGLPFLKEAIDSTLNQSFTDFEYLIIDDASPDEKVANFIESYDDRRIRFIRNENNLGVSETINKALNLIETTYVIRLDQDDISLPDRIKDQVSYLQKNTDISILCSWQEMIDDNGRKVNTWRKRINNYGEFLAPVLLGICPIIHPSLAFRTEDMLKSGGFKPDYVRAEDFELTARMALERYNAAIIPKYHLKQRYHPGSQSHEFSDQQKSVSNRIQTEAISQFIDYEDAQKLSSFLRLEKCYKSNIFDKKYLLEMHDLLILMLGNAERKQQLNNDEFSSLKRIIYFRLGLGVYVIPVLKYLPSFFFVSLFLLFSPLYSNKIHKVISRVYNVFKF